MRFVAVSCCLLLRLAGSSAKADFDEFAIFGNSLVDDGGAHGIRQLVDDAIDTDVVRCSLKSTYNVVHTGFSDVCCCLAEVRQWPQNEGLSQRRARRPGLQTL